MAPSILEILWKLDLLGPRHPGEGRDAHVGLLKPCVKIARGMGGMGVPGDRGC